MTDTLIPLTRGKFALVSEADYDWVSQWKWHYLAQGYAGRRECQDGTAGKYMILHRALLERTLDRSLIPGEMTDHINGDKLDNRRENLRLCTNQENTWNQKTRVHSSIYKGVCWDKANNKWRVFVKAGDVRYSGRFTSEIAAALAYDEKAKKYFGEFARTNF